MAEYHAQPGQQPGLVEEPWKTKPMADWTNSEVCAWVRSLPQPFMARVLAPKLAEQDVDGAALAGLTTHQKAKAELDLRIGHARALVKEIGKYVKPVEDDAGGEGPAAAEETITLCIQMSNRRTVRLNDIKLDYTIAQVKQFFVEKDGPTRNPLVLRSIQKGTCDNSDTLRSHGVTRSNNMLFQVLKQRGGSQETFVVKFRGFRADDNYERDFWIRKQDGPDVGHARRRLAKARNSSREQIVFHVRHFGCPWVTLTDDQQSLEIAVRGLRPCIVYVEVLPLDAVESETGTEAYTQMETAGGEPRSGSGNGSGSDSDDAGRGTAGGPSGGAGGEHEDDEQGEVGEEEEEDDESESWRDTLRKGSLVDLAEYEYGGGWEPAFVVGHQKGADGTLRIIKFGQSRQHHVRRSSARLAMAYSRCDRHTTISDMKQEHVLDWAMTFGGGKGSKRMRAAWERKYKELGPASDEETPGLTDEEWTLAMPAEHREHFYRRVQRLQRDPHYFEREARRMKEEAERREQEQLARQATEKFRVERVVRRLPLKLRDLPKYSKLVGSGRGRDCVHGLANLGNTCFFNSVVQVLVQMPGFVEYFLNMYRTVEKGVKQEMAKRPQPSWAKPWTWGRSSVPAPFTDSNTVVEALVQLLRDVHIGGSGTRPNPKSLHDQLARLDAEYSRLRQDDSFVAFEILLKGLDEELQKYAGSPQEMVSDVVAYGEPEKDAEKVRKLFARHMKANQSIVPLLLDGVEAVQFTCLSCQYGERCYQTFRSLPVPVVSVNAPVSVVVPAFGQVLTVRVQADSTLATLKALLGYELEQKHDESLEPEVMQLVGLRRTAADKDHRKGKGKSDYGVVLLDDDAAMAASLESFDLIFACEKPPPPAVGSVCFRIVWTEGGTAEFRHTPVVMSLPFASSEDKDVEPSTLIAQVERTFREAAELKRAGLALTVVYGDAVLRRDGPAVEFDRDAVMVALWAPRGTIPRLTREMLGDAADEAEAVAMQVFESLGGEFQDDLVKQRKQVADVLRKWRGLRRQQRHQLGKWRRGSVLTDSRTRALELWLRELDVLLAQTGKVTELFHSGLEAYTAALRQQGVSLVAYEAKQELESLAECLTAMQTPVTYGQQQRAYDCPDCHEAHVFQRQRSLVQGPRVLVVRLERFDTESRRSRGRSYDYGPAKVTRPIVYGHTLQLAGSEYRLFGACCHHGGSSHSGHYTARVKSLATGSWHSISDSHAHKTSRDGALEFEDAMVLFYERR